MNFLRPGDVVVDIGANVGYYTLISASAVGSQGMVHAFEPNPQVARLLEVSIERGHLKDRVLLNLVALGSSSGTATLYLPADERDSVEASMVSGWVEREGTLVVPVVTLDEYCSQHGITSIRLLKLDVEGAELEVLIGAEHVLDRIRPDAIVCEFFPSRRATAQAAVLELFQRHRYKSHFIDSDGCLKPHDGTVPQWEWGNLCFLPLEGADGG